MSQKKKKIYVLDTSVILYSHDSIMNFEENDIGIPITVLEELDQMKKGNDTLNFEAREFIRMIDKLSIDKMLNDWIPLNGKTNPPSPEYNYTDADIIAAIDQARTQNLFTTGVTDTASRKIEAGGDGASVLAILFPPEVPVNPS